MLYEQRANNAVTTRLSRANHALLDAFNPYKTSILGRGDCGAKRDVVGHWNVRPQAVAPNGKKNTFEIECKDTHFFWYMQILEGNKWNILQICNGNEQYTRFFDVKFAYVQFL